MALLPFQSEILEQILDNKRALWVVHAGLGLKKVLAHYLAELENRNLSRLLYLFLSPDPQVPIFEKLVQQAPHRFKLINSDYTSEQRQQIWEAGGLRFVTSRILIVDMLTGIIPWKKLGGIIYYMNPGQLIKENSTENFILRVYAQQVLRANKQYDLTYHSRKESSSTLPSNVTPFDGYNDASKADTTPEKDHSHFLNIKAFTESPSDLAKGWNTLEKVARILKTGSKVYLWPRYRKSVLTCLDAKGPETVDISVSLAPIQAQIHQQLILIFQLCIEDLKRRVAGQTSNGTFAPSATETPITEADISYQNALFSNFYSGIQSILEPLGSKVPNKIRSLLHDISLLRDLIRTLIRSDAVKFFERWQNLIRDQSSGGGFEGRDGPASLDWLHFKEADVVTSLAQKRLWKTPSQLYKAPFSDAAGSLSKNGSGVSESDAMIVDDTSFDAPLTLEDNGKWRSLLDVIQEIEEANNAPGSKLGSQPIVIFTKDEEARRSLTEYLSLSNPTLYLLSRLKSHILRKVDSLERSKAAKKPIKQQNFFADTTQPARHKTSGDSVGEAIEVDDDEKVPSALPESSAVSRALKEKKTMYAKLLQEVEERISIDAAIRISEQIHPNLDGGLGSTSVVDDTSNDYERYFGLVQPDPVVKRTPILIQAWEGQESYLSSFFEDVSPHFVILYDPDPTIVRQVECYKAGRTGWFVRLYVLIYKDSLEHDKFFSQIEQEQALFRKLIVAKEKLVEEDAETQADLVSKVSANAVNGLSQRKGGLASLPSPSLVLGSGILSTSLKSPSNISLSDSEATVQEEIVIVDMREFRSKLPGMLHQHGITIRPQTLVIADYILSPEIAVERKSLPDLRQSFRSGHLYNQTENLTRIYAKPILLIEFDSSEPFELMPMDRIQSGRLSIHDISSQLALLTKSFPKLRVCWSRSPAQTAQLFLALKKGKPQPNAVQVSLQHGTLNPDLSSHTDETGPAEESSNAKSRSYQNKQLLQSASGLEELGGKQHTSPNSNRTVATLGPNLAPFYPFDVLQRLPGLNRRNNWKPLLYPSTGSDSPVATPSSPLSQNNSPTKLAAGENLVTTTRSSPTKEVENPLDGSLFEIDDEELETPEPSDIAPRALQPKLLLQTPTKPSGVSPSSSAPSSPTKSLPSLAALADVSLPTLTTALGSKVGKEIHTFLHQPVSKERLTSALGESADSGKGRRARGFGGSTPGRGRGRKTSFRGPFK